MQKSLLKVSNLFANVGEKELLKGVDLEIKPGEVHVLMGPNGAGKSTLASVIMGDPRYDVTSGNILFEGEDITNASPDQRAKAGIFLSFQAPEEIEGVTLETFLRAAKNAVTGKKVSPIAFHHELESKMEEFQMNNSYASRYLNVGFSGGEKKKSEILQLSILNPKLAILDETDSGLDVDAVKTIAENIQKFKTSNNAVLIITHITRILENLPIDYVHIISDGKIVKTTDASIIQTISDQGFASVVEGK